MGKKALVLALGCLVAVSVFTTIAFVVRKADTGSVITFGNLMLKPHLYTMEGEEEVEVDTNEVLPISNLSSLSRILNIENVGNHPMYVRVGFDTFATHDHSRKIEGVIDIDEKEGWIYHDGWYYYDAVLNPGDTTTNLMDEIKFDSTEVAKYKGGDIDFKLNVEAVQSEHNEDHVLDAKGWPQQKE